jgi:hypothetical protein
VWVRLHFIPLYHNTPKIIATMNHKIVLIAGILIASGILSFRTIDQAQPEVKIIVSSDQPVQFNMFRNVTVSRNLKTPYEFTFTKSDSKFIFKSLDTKGKMTVTVQQNGNTTIKADWPLVVLLIEGEAYTCFGMD